MKKQSQESGKYNSNEDGKQMKEYEKEKGKNWKKRSKGNK